MDDARWCLGPTCGRGLRGFSGLWRGVPGTGDGSRKALALRAGWVWVVVVRRGVGVSDGGFGPSVGAHPQIVEQQAWGAVQLAHGGGDGFAVHFDHADGKGRSPVMFSGPWPVRMRLLSSFQLSLSSRMRCSRGRG